MRSKILSVFIIITSCINFAFGQEDTLANLFYSVKQNNRLYYFFEQPNQRKTITKFKSLNLKEKEIYHRLTFIPNSSSIWRLEGEELYRISVSQQKQSLGSADIYTHKIASKDSLQSVLELEKSRIEFQEKYGHLDIKKRREKAVERMAQRMKRNNVKSIPIFRVFSIQNLEEKMRNPSSNENNIIALDFLVRNLNERNFRFYFRFKDFFTIWEYRYPTINDDENHQGKWKEILTYSNTTLIPFLNVANANDYYPSGLKDLTKWEAIKDKAFFEGEFKVIQQGKNQFVINTKHGAIYHIGASQIVKVGQIELKEYKRRIGGKSLFIEDKDEKEVIFFAPVKVISNKVNAPSLKTKVILDDYEFSRIFKNL